MIWDILLQSCSERWFLDNLTTLACLEISHSEPSECAGHPAKPRPSLSTSTALLLFPPLTITLRAGPALLRLLKICLQDPAHQPLPSPYGWDLNVAQSWGELLSCFWSRKRPNSGKPWRNFWTSPRRPPCRLGPAQASQEVDSYRDVWACASWRTAPLTALSCSTVEQWIRSKAIKVTSTSVSLWPLDFGSCGQRV